MPLARLQDAARPGYFRTRLVKGGVWVPAVIRRICVCTVNGGGDQVEHDWNEECDRYPRLEAEVDLKPAAVDRVWMSGEPITKAQYDYLVTSTAWDRENDINSPAATPRKAIDLDQVDPGRFKP